MTPEHLLPDGRRPVGAAVLLHPNGTTLLQHRDQKKWISNPGRWSLFGGGLEDGETAAEGMLRELEEEIGVRPQKFRPLVVLEGATAVYHLFLARLDHPLDELVLGEGQGMAYVEPELALRVYDLAPVARSGLEITLVVLTMRRSQGLETPFDGW